MRTYYETLAERGVEDYPYEACAEDYRRAALLLSVFVVTNQESFDIDSYNERAQQLFETILRRYTTAIVDLNAAEFLPE